MAKQEIVALSKLSRSEWLEKRKTGIGASEAAAVMGQSPWAGPLEVFAAKVQGYTQPVTPAMQAGIRIEPVILKWFSEKTGKTIKPSVFARHQHIPYIIATPDALVVESTRHRKAQATVQAKMTRSDEGWGEPETDDIPQHILLQVAQEMMVMDVPVAYVPVLFGGLEFRCYVVERDREIENLIVDAESSFWHDFIKPQIPPEDFGSPGIASYLAWRYPKALQPIREATAEELELARQLRLYLGVARTADTDVTELKNKLKERIGEAEGITIDGEPLRWSQRKGLISWKNAALEHGVTKEEAEAHRGSPSSKGARTTSAL